MTDKPRDSDPQPTSDTRMSSDAQPLEEWTTPAGNRIRLWSGDAWLARTGQGNHATLSTRPLRTPAPAPALDLEDGGSTATQPELAENG
jgi:hypothetical protein